MAIGRLRSEEQDTFLDFLARAQSDRASSTTYLGEGLAGLRAELADLDPPWTVTLRVSRDGRGSIAAAALVSWDSEAGQAWVCGPWVEGSCWSPLAEPLLGEILGQVPPSIDRLEMAAPVQNLRLAGLAAKLGWTPTEVNHAFVLEGPMAESVRAEFERRLPDPGDSGSSLRSAVEADLDGVAALHDLEFPSTYYSAKQLLEQHGRGAALVIVGEDEGGRISGYIAGRIHPDGEAYIDFVAVRPEARRRGLGRRLVVEAATQLLVRATIPRVCLTVRDSLHPARSLYDALGFRLEGSFLGYRLFRERAKTES